MAMFTRLILASGFVFVGLASSAPASADCIRVGEHSYVNGQKVASCNKPKVMRPITAMAGIHTKECEGKPAGHRYLALGPDGKRLAVFKCRG